MGEPLPPPTGVQEPTRPSFIAPSSSSRNRNYDTALGYLQSGQYRWNAGMFVWSFVTVTEGLQKHQPEMYAACQRWFKVANQPAKLAKVLAKEYPDIKKVSIDYALMEKAHNVVVCRRRVRVGRPRLMDGARPPPQSGRRKATAPWRISSTWTRARNIIYDARSKDRRTPIAVVGLRDSILVQTDDAVLLAHKSQAQKVKELVKKLAEDAKLKKLV